MSLSRAKIFIVILVASLSSSATAAPLQHSQNTPAPQAARGPDYVDFTGFKGKVFDVKYRDPRSLVMALQPLGSGFKGAGMQYSDEFKTLTVRDFPENIAAIEEALKRLDTPQSPQPDVELRMHVLIASNVEGVANQYPADIGDVIKQLQATLNYKSYSNVATVIQRVKVGSRNIGLNGIAEIPAKILEIDRPQSANYNFRAQSLGLATDGSGGSIIQLADQEFALNGPNVGQAQIKTDLNLRAGEKVVVGTATLGNKGLILVLSAKIIK